MLGEQREQRDVPGSVIPYLYREYLAQRQEAHRQSRAVSNDLTDDMQRVMYHNLLDILSMVTLTSRLVDVLLQPRDAAEQFASARFYERAGEYVIAERGYRSAAEARANGAPHSESLRRLARLLKRQGRVSEALLYWQQLCDAGDAEALIEAAKYYEWREVDLPRALAHAQDALRLSNDSATRAAISHRVERLQRKLNAHQAKSA
jgi:tetratricopeptide (TPR) repeat protein